MVHQNCIGLFYKQKENLDKVLFYSPPHGEKTKQKKQDQTKKSSASGLRRFGGKKRKLWNFKTLLKYVIFEMTEE